MAFGKKPVEKDGTGIYTLQGSVVFCGRCGHGCRLATSDLTGGPYRCRKCTRIFCGRCFSDFHGLCVDDVGAAAMDGMEFIREHGLMDLLFTDSEPNIVLEIGGQVAHYDGKTRRLISGTGWKLEEHWLCITENNLVKAKVDSTEITKIYGAGGKSKLVDAIHEWNRKYRVRLLPGSEAPAKKAKA